MEELKDGDMPEEPVSQQLWKLLYFSNNVSQRSLVATLQLLAEVPWTNLACEQLHGSLAAFRKWHPDFGTTSLVARALMHQFMRVLSWPVKSRTRYSKGGQADPTT